MPDAERASPTTTRDTRRLLHGLRTLRGRARRLVLTRYLLGGLGVALLTLLGVGLADYLLRMPMGLRLALWLLGLGAMGWWCWSKLRPALAFCPSLPEMALRVERSPTGQKAGLGGWLASAVEFAKGDADSPMAAHLQGRVVDRAVEAFASIDPTETLDATGTRRRGWRAALAVVALIAVVIVSPTLAGIGAVRALAPWAGVKWPSRTAVVDVSDLEIHPMGVAAPIRGLLTRTHQSEGETDIAVRHRLVIDGDAGPWRRALLTSQGRETIGGSEGELFERLVDPMSPALLADGPAEATLEYTLSTEDDQTEPSRILLVRPPEVRSATLEVSPPSYAAAYAGRAETEIVSGEIDLGPGDDERAIAGPILERSRLTLTIDLNKPTPAAKDIASIVGDGFSGETASDATLQASEDRWTISWTALGAARLPITVADKHGLTNDAASVYTIEVRPDGAPRVALLEPARDEAVLATAVVDLQGEIVDDVGAAWLTLEWQRAEAPSESEGAPAEPVGEVNEIAREASDSGARRLDVAAVLDLSPLELEAGDEVWLTATGLDTFVLGAESRVPVRTPPRRLRIIAESALIEQIQGELGGVRESAIRLDEQQAELQRQTGLVGVTTETRRGQVGVGERLAAIDEQLERLGDRLERNRLSDDALDDLLGESRDLLRRAGEASDEASETLSELDQREAPPAPGDRAYEPATDGQQGVRSELERLIELLDRGEDAWVVRRQLDRLIEEQRGLEAETQRASEELLGKPSESLTPQERSQLADLAERQQEAAERTEEVLDELSERARSMRESDPMQSDAMARAASQGRQSQASQKQREAAESVEQNQTNQAQEQQAEAIEALEDVREALEEAGRNRDETLKRVLESVLASIDRLIRTQRSELTRLNEANGAFEGLDASMIRLRDNTLGVAGDARAQMRELERVASLIEDAADAQGEAIVALRLDPVDVEEAQGRERRALELLEEAKSEAEKMQRDAENRDNARKREELLKAYREALELEVALRGEAEAFVGQELTRRQRVAVRRLGERQEAIRTTLAELRADTEEMNDARVFDYAHERLDAKTASAAAGLKTGRPEGSVLRDQTAAIRVLQGLVRSLEEDEQDEEFRDGDAGGGGGGGGQEGQPAPPIPPIAELRLLRDLQQEAADLTREADEGDVERGELRELGELQRSLADLGQDLLERAEASQPGGSFEPEMPEPLQPGPEPAPEGPPDEPGADEPNGNTSGTEDEGTTDG